MEGKLDIQVLYAGRTFLGDLSPTQDPGIYATEIFPTVRGQYQVRLAGMIEGMEIDEMVEIEEVLSNRVLAFPEVQPEPRDLQANIETPQSQLRIASILAIAGIVLGVAGLGIGLFSLLRSRK